MRYNITEVTGVVPAQTKEAEMPELVIKFKKNTSTLSERRAFARNVRPVVAQFINPKWSDDFVDVIFLEIDEDSIIGGSFAMDLRTIGYEDRKKILDIQGAKRLKSQIARLDSMPEAWKAWARDPQSLWMWVIFEDPAGPHV